VQRVQRGEAGSRSKSLWGDETAPSLTNARGSRFGAMPEDKLGLFRRLVIDRYERRIVARRDYVILVYTDAEAVFGHDRATVA
jgi:hypothetical protein